MTQRAVAEQRARGELEWNEHWLKVDAELDLSVLLRHRVPVPANPERIVLLVPGANSSADTFVLPRGGLVAYLAARGCDVWMLDWRVSPLVLNQVLKRKLSRAAIEAERAAFSLDRMVQEDIPAALRFIRQANPRSPLAIHGHCVGGGGLAMAVARGLLEPFDVDRIVLSTLGLFYEVHWNTWVKAEDLLLESILLPEQDPDCRSIDPRAPETWPPVYRDAYQHWPSAWQPTGSTPSDLLLRQLSFMVGQPYTRARLDPSIDGPPVDNIFGPLHLGLYTHLGQMVRRGYSAEFNSRDQIDRGRLQLGIKTEPGPRGDLVRDHFERYPITLVAAGDNGVWHRDSIDLMFEWLRRSPTVRCEKYIIPEYNIQEIYWGPDAPVRTYEIFAHGLGVGSRG